MMDLGSAGQVFLCFVCFWRDVGLEDKKLVTYYKQVDKVVPSEEEKK